MSPLQHIAIGICLLTVLGFVLGYRVGRLRAKRDNANGYGGDPGGTRRRR